MKKIICCVLCVLTLCLLCGAVQANAATIVDSGTCGAEGDNLTWTLDDAGTLTISGTGEMVDYAGSFSTDSPSPPWGFIKSVVIQSGVTSIGDYAFCGESSLTSITIPDSVRSIGDYALSWCSGLTSITIPKGVTSIGERAFNGCGGLSAVDVATTNSVYCAIDGNLYTKDVKRLIWYVEGKTETAFAIPDSVTSIDSYAFFNSNLTSITIPKSVTSIGVDAFYYATRLSEVHISDIAAWCAIDFAGANSNPLYSRAYLYLNNTLITNLTIPDSATRIGDYAFYGYEKLTGVTLHANVTDIGYQAFCSAFAPGGGFSTAAKNPKYCAIDGNLFTKDRKTLLYYPEKKQSAIYSIPDGVTSIGDGAFHKCSSLSGINIPNSVTSIGESAFYGCDGLISVTIPDSVTSIGESAFYYCSKLTNIMLPKNLTTISNGMLSGCSFTSIKIPDGVTSIGILAFSGCSDLESIVIPDSVTSIGELAFCSCDNLTSITIPDSVTSIGESAFAQCYGLKSVTIEEGVTNIGKNVFDSCSNLVKVDLPDSLTYISDHMFNACSNLEEICLPASVTHIGRQAFLGTALTSITIPDGTESIGIAAFYTCGSLASVTIPDSVTSIGDGAFGYCWKLKDVYYEGAEVQWERISISALDNEALAAATMHYKFAYPKSITVAELTKADNITFTANLTSADGGLLIVARYGENGKYLGMNIYTAATQVPVSVVNDCETVKVMWWDGFYTMRILAPVVELDI